MKEFEKAQQQQLSIQHHTISSKKEEVLAVASTLKMLIAYKSNSLQDELEQIPVTKVHSGNEQ